MLSKIKEIQGAIAAGIAEYEGLTLPSPQRAGTMMQQNTYAFLKAQEIYEKHFSYSAIHGANDGDCSKCSDH